MEQIYGLIYKVYLATYATLEYAWILGKYVLNENELLENTVPEDTSSSSDWLKQPGLQCFFHFVSKSLDSKGLFLLRWFVLCWSSFPPHEATECVCSVRVHLCSFSSSEEAELCFLSSSCHNTSPASAPASSSTGPRYHTWIGCLGMRNVVFLFRFIQKFCLQGFSSILRPSLAVVSLHTAEPAFC